MKTFGASLGGGVVGGLLVFLCFFLTGDPLHQAFERLNHPQDSVSIVPVQLPYSPPQNIPPRRFEPDLQPLPEEVITPSPLVKPIPQESIPLHLAPEEEVAVKVYEKVNQSVVNITTRSYRYESMFFPATPSDGAGSGSVIDLNGHILTNYHVIEGSTEIAVTLFDGNTYDAAFVGSDPMNDIAIVRINAPPETLHPVDIGISHNLKVGMRVFALGNPFGLERTLTTGIISSLNRSLQIRGNRSVKSIIQIDAAINPGSSGGPLLNSQGMLIGMNTAIASKNGQSAGVGFAIPSSLIRQVVPELIEHGRVIRADIGITRIYQKEEGLLIAGLMRDGPAEQAGIQGPRLMRRGPVVYLDRSAADMIVAVDGQPIESADQFITYIESKRPRESVVLTVLRKGRETKVRVVLSEAPTDL
ncbi:Periplasmic pH-dependent serine endoprotease DegQ [Planctomycetales bacterium 10988]|nr:Periplasmic pH-dependent serine endoprotease DegQ [Planctomycetales bacterium 10988]